MSALLGGGKQVCLAGPNWLYLHCPKARRGGAGLALQAGGCGRVCVPQAWVYTQRELCREAFGKACKCMPAHRREHQPMCVG